MAQKQFDKGMAGHLWDRMSILTSNHRVYPKQHKGNVLFVGYADFTIQIDGIPVLALPGNSIKLMGDQVHFDPKSEKARDGSNRYFPIWLPVSAEARAVITERLKQDPQIIEMCHQAVNRVTEASPAMAADANPFGG